MANGDDKTIQYPISMPDSTWALLEHMIDLQEDTSISRSEMVRICVEKELHRFLIESDPRNKRNKSFFKEAYKRVVKDES